MKNIRKIHSLSFFMIENNFFSFVIKLGLVMLLLKKLAIKEKKK